MVYFGLNVYSGLNNPIVHVAQSVTLDLCAVVQGLELCKHISAALFPLARAYFVPSWEASGCVGIGRECETAVLPLKCIMDTSKVNLPLEPSGFLLKHGGVGNTPHQRQDP